MPRVKVCPVCSRGYPSAVAICPRDGVALVVLDASARPESADLSGQVVDGRYRVEQVIGRGGMGTVYACRHTVVNKAVAMKVLDASIERSERALQRLIREAQLANTIRSRHIVETLDFGQLPNGCFYVVMDLCEGESLFQALKTKRLTRSDLAHVFVQLAETLELAHEQGVVHRDLKPDNVLLVHESGDPLFVKLVDFGIAKVLKGDNRRLTRSGAILGTPHYMSPEQARAERVDGRSDIYSLGVMMYEAFSGRLPFTADTTLGVLIMHVNDTPPPPSDHAEIDPKAERLIMRCLEKDRAARFQAIAEVTAGLRGLPFYVPPVYSRGADAARTSISMSTPAPAPATINAAQPEETRRPSSTPTVNVGRRAAPAKTPVGRVSTPPSTPSTPAPSPTPGALKGRRTRWLMTAGAIAMFAIGALAAVASSHRDAPRGERRAAPASPPSSERPRPPNTADSAWRATEIRDPF